MSVDQNENNTILWDKDEYIDEIFGDETEGEDVRKAGETAVSADKPADGEGPEEEHGQYRRPRKNKKKKAIIIASACAAGVILAVVMTLIILGLKSKDPVGETGGMYFTSDMLTVEGDSFTVYDKIEFKVRNFADELRVSGSDIEDYTVSVQAGSEEITGKCKITKEQKSLAGGSAVSAGVVIEVPDDVMDKTIEVSVSYEAEQIVLKGKFTVLPSWSWTYSDRSGSVCGKLYIAANKEVTLKASWDPELVIADPTNPYVKSGGNGKSCTLTLAAGTGTEIYFFKNDVSADYSADGQNVVTVESAADSSSDGKKKKTDETTAQDTTSADTTAAADTTGN